MEELRHSEFQIVPGQPDIEGWSIYDYAHNKIGTVHDLLFDPEARKVRYIIARVAGIGDKNERQVLIPIGMAELHATSDEVVLTDASASQISQFSPYPYDALKNNATVGSAIDLDSDTDQPHFDDQHFYRNRNMQSDAISGLTPDIEAELKKDKTSVNTIGIRLRSRIIAGNADSRKLDADSEEL